MVTKNCRALRARTAKGLVGEPHTRFKEIKWGLYGTFERLHRRSVRTANTFINSWVSCVAPSSS